MPPQKKRKGKANDGSKVDVTDVMDAMAAASAPPPKRPLFFVDTQGPALTRQERKARAREKALHSDKILLPDDVLAAVPLGEGRALAVTSGARLANRELAQRTREVQRSRVSKSESVHVSRLAERRQQKQQQQQQQSKKRKHSTTNIVDPWQEEGPHIPDDAILNTFMVEEYVNSARPIKRPRGAVAPAYRVAAVRPAHAGQSYMPEYTQYQTAIAAVHERLVADDAKQQLERSSLGRGAYAKVTASTSSVLVPLDMLADPSELAHPIRAADRPRYPVEETADGNSDRPDEQDEAARAAKPLASKLPQRKTSAQRHRQALHRARERRIRARKFHRRLLAQVDRVKSIARNVEQETQARQAKIERCRALLAARAGQTVPRIGGRNVPKPVESFLLQDELSQNLRTVKASVHNPLAARFASILERNMLEPASVRSRTKTSIKTKMVYKRSVREELAGTSLELDAN